MNKQEQKNKVEEKNKLYCKECGEPLPIDEEKSNENWTVQAPQCPCGGEPDFERMIKELTK